MGILWANTGAIGCIVLKCYLPVVPQIMSNYQPSSIHALENCQAVAGRQRMAQIMPFPEEVPDPS